MKNFAVLILAFSDLAKDARVHRQLLYLTSKNAHLTTIGFNPSPLSQLHIPIPQKKSIKTHFLKKTALFLGLYERHYWNNPQVQIALQALCSKKFDLIIANDLDTLPLAVKLANSETPLLYDAHEYAPKEWEESWVFRQFQMPQRTYLCKKYLPSVTSMVTVSEGIALEYEKEFGVSCKIITNATPFIDLHPQKVDPNEIKMIYHGVALPSRNIEAVIDIFSLLDKRFTLDILLVPGSTRYIQKIKKRACHISRIRFLDPVPMEKISSFCNAYDIGFFPLQPHNLNYRFALANKFFEFIQARIALAISPLQEMKKIVDHYANGFVASDFSNESFAEMLNRATAESLLQMKKNSDRAARELNAEKNFQIFDEILQKMTTPSKSCGYSKNCLR